MSPPGAETIPAALAASAGNATLLEGGEEGRALSFQVVRERSLRVAAGLAEAGLAPGDRLLLVLTTGEEFLASFFGCILAGVVPCQVSPPEGFGSAEAFQRRLGELADVVAARGVVARGALAEQLRAECSLQVFTPAGLLAASGAPPAVEVAPGDLAFIQFTSGTTRTPKAVRVTHRAVAANTRQIGEATRMGPGSVVVSWLPMFHDMGLVGMLTALFRGASVVLSPPSRFLRRPATWLRAIDRFRGTHSPAPTFAYGYAAARARDEELEGIDLSCWTTAYVGAEPISTRVLAAFERRFTPHGLDPTALTPCYGLAEATLGVTMKPFGTRLRTLAVSRAGLAREGRLAAPTGEPSDALELVSCGEPLDGTGVEVVDEAGASLPEGALGEVVARGPSLYAGYHGLDPPDAPPAALHTGDLGFLADGELYVTGRQKDLIILHGQNVHPEEVEWVATRVPGIRPGRVAAVGLEDPAAGTERLCLVVEYDRRAGVTPADLEVELRRRVHAESGLVLDRLELAAPGALPLTTSGKIQRSRARQLLERHPGEGT